jgi:hypothetical protein
MEQGGSGDVSDMTDAREEIEQRLNLMARSRRPSMIGRSTSTCAGALMSAQILMRRDSAARRRRKFQTAAAESCE